jgi:succinyl-CoA synthetase beta subunit
VLPVEASVRNPVDLIASADAARYRAALKAVVADPTVEGLVVLFVSPVMIDAAAVAQAIVDETRGCGRPVLACVMGRQRGDEAQRILRDAGHELPEQKRILEVNPTHPVVQKLKAIADADETKFAQWTSLLHDQALLAEGVLPSDPAGFAKQIAQLMAQA